MKSDKVNVSIGIGIFWVAKQTTNLGYDVLLSGQGADEYFGGYKRYIDIYSEFGEEILQKIIFNDVTKLHEVNLERDIKICEYHNLELRLPYVSHQLAEFSSSLPMKFKFNSQWDLQRKDMLRKVATNLGVPNFIVNKPKKAIQYSTGINKILHKIAKKKGVSVKEYISEEFKKIFS